MVVSSTGPLLAPQVEKNGHRVASPKPDEWPIADLRLSESNDRPQSGVDRRYTIPYVQCPPVVIQRQLGGPGGGGGLPLADASSLLDRRNTVTTMDPREMQQVLIHSHPPGRSSVTSPNPIWATTPLWGPAPPNPQSLPSSSELSEYNLFSVRDSLTQPLPPIMEGGRVSSSHLSLFATMAEDAARQTRRLADWAAQMAKAGVSRKSSSDQLGLGVSEHGSSVDVFQDDEPKLCPLAQQRDLDDNQLEGRDVEFEGISRTCPVRHEAGATSDQPETESKDHSNCSVM